MTIVRAIDAQNDWLFGKGRNDYRAANDAVAQNIHTRLQCFINDCFFDNAAGLDWFNLMSSKNQIAVNLGVSATIINTAFVVSLLQLSLNLSPRTRGLTGSYQVLTVYSKYQSNFALTIAAG